MAKQIREQSNAGLIIFSYLNPILQFGLEKFCAAAADAGVDGALVTDLPVEEAGDYLKAMKAHKLAPVFLAAPTSTEQRLRDVARHSRGFVYAISRTGITGARQELAGDARSLVERLARAIPNCPSRSASASRLRAVRRGRHFADAAVVGSAIVQRIEQNPGREAAAVSEFLSSLTGAAEPARAGA